jgi:poly-beta-1,6-N-acetyl-D-glucosamine synthase
MTANPWDMVAAAGAVASFIALASTYVLYPLAMRSLARRRARPWKMDDATFPTVTMVVCAHNEEGIIRRKIENFLALQYPAERLFLLVGSDGSTDATNAILAEYCDGTRLRSIAFDRLGKQRMTNELMRHVHTDVTVFSDANVLFDPVSITRMVRHFGDPAIGGVCGFQRMRPLSGSIAGESEERYWNYENRIKEWESSFYTTLGASGGMYAIRTALFVEHTTDWVADDLLLPMRIVGAGYRFAYDRTAVSDEETSISLRVEFRRKIRLMNGTLRTYPHLRKLFGALPRRIHWMLFFHKFLRWLSPAFVLLFAACTLLLLHIPFVFYGVFIPCLALVVLTVPGFLAELSGKKLGALSMPYYFFATNLAVLIAYFKLPFKHQGGIWERLPRR